MTKRDEHDDEDTSSCSTSASADLWSDEIPVWVHNEQRFISGITEDTTCAELIEAILQDECVTGKPDFTSKNPKDYVITERWKKVEQVLDGRTQILSIWNAWGNAQPEVRFTLRPFTQHFREMWQNSGDRDSGRGSPTGSINSGVVRRKRHKASKSSLAWAAHGNTIHPKSQKGNIERLMKLILEQGEIIQHQLSKLRDREVEITNIEEERHKLREKEHGKNYLLETYLKGLQECEEKGSGSTGDSGVHTEEVTTSPEVGVASPVPEEAIALEPQRSQESNDDLTEQIELLEKVVSINKKLQKEEEMIVRLSAKIKRYEADASGLSEQQVKEALDRVSVQIDSGNSQLKKMETKIKSADTMLQEKSIELRKLYDELEEVEVENHRLAINPQPTREEHEFPLVSEANLNLSREYLAENMYNVSKAIIGEPSLTVEDADMFVHPIEPPSQFCTPYDPNKLPAQAQVLNINSSNAKQSSTGVIPKQSTYNVKDFYTSMNYLERYNQRNINSMTATNLKLGPKKLINGIVMQKQQQQQDTNSNSSDTGLSMGSSAAGEPPDFTQLGTLV